jgi:hypothetical protein
LITTTPRKFFFFAAGLVAVVIDCSSGSRPAEMAARVRERRVLYYARPCRDMDADQSMRVFPKKPKAISSTRIVDD